MKLALGIAVAILLVGGALALGVMLSQWTRPVGLPVASPDSSVAPAAIPRPPPVSAEQTRAATDGLAALKALQSVTRVGVTYAEYMRRLGDAKIKIDQASDQITEAPVRVSLESAMLYYEGTGQVWNAKIQKSDMRGILQIFTPNCQPLAELMRGAQSPSCVRSPGAAIPTDPACYMPEAAGVETMMGCATQQVAEASRLIERRP